MKILLLFIILTTTIFSTTMEIHSTKKLSTDTDRKSVVTSFGGSDFFTNVKNISGKYCKIWYNEIDVDSLKIDEEYARLILGIADSSISVYQDLGYHLPPNDKENTDKLGIDYENGGDNLIDIYLVDISSRGFLGITNQDGILKEKNSYDQDIAPSYILLDDDYFIKNAIYDTLKITVSHELFHVIQNGYLMFSPKYYYTQVHTLMEMTAVTMEEMLHPNVNDYVNMVPYYFELSSLAPFPSDLNDGKSIESYYGSSVWMIYLVDLYGIDIVKFIWEGVEKGKSPLQTIEEIFESKGLNFSDFWERFINQMLILPSEKSEIRDSELLPAYLINSTLTTTAGITSKNYTTDLYYGLDGLYYEMNSENWVSKKSTTRGFTYYSFLALANDSLAQDSVFVSNDSNDVGLKPFGNLFIYPNPIYYSNFDKISIGNNIFKELELKIYNIKGELISEQYLTTSSFSLPKTTPSGVYILSLKGENNKIVHLRFVVIK